MQSMRTALLAASALFMASAASDEGNAASPAIQQCVNPDTGAIWNTEFCKCLGLVRNRVTDEWIIAGTDPALCPKRDASIGLAPGDLLDGENGQNGGNGGNGQTAFDWPGWGGNQAVGAPGDGTGDQKHNHAGPPTASPGQSIAGPPGQRG